METRLVSCKYVPPWGRKQWLAAVLLTPGVCCIAELGKKIQEQMLAKDNKKEEKAMVSLLDSSKKIQERMLAELGKDRSKTAAAVLV